jgi:PAS domain S-box-containing protein
MATCGAHADTIAVLHVDDDEDFGEITKIYLERSAPMCVEYSSSVSDAISLLKKRHYDAIVSDYQMPVTDGIAFLRILREEEGIDLPFVMLTGKGREEVAMLALNIGANRYLQKGGDPKTLYGLLSDAIVHEVRHYRSEKALQEREHMFRLLADNSIDCIWKLDKRLKFTYLSPSLERMTGFKPEEWVGTSLGSHFKKKEFIRVGALALKAIRNYKSFPHVTFETKMLDKYGGEVELEISSKALLDKSGKLIGLQGTTRLIDERRKSEQRIKDLYSMLRFTHDVNQLIHKEPGLKALMQDMCDAMQSNRDYKNIEIALADAQSGAIVPMAYKGILGKRSWSYRHNDCDTAPTCIRECAKAGNTVIYQGREPSCAGCMHGDTCTTYSTVVIPLVQKRLLTGFLSATMLPRHTITPEEVELLEAVASNLGYAADKYRIEDELQKMKSGMTSGTS